MSQRTYKKDHQSVVIESTGDTKKTPEDNDIWHTTVTLDEGVVFSSILWTTQVKELIAQLSSKGWKKEELGEKETV